MEGKSSRFWYADSDNSDTWLIFQNVYGKNEFVSLVFMFTLGVTVIDDFGWWQQKINKLNKINKNQWSLSGNGIDEGFGLPFMITWDVRYWDCSEPASIYQVSVTPIFVVLLMVIQNSIACTIFGKCSTRPFRSTYKLWLNNNTKSGQFLTFT